MALKITVIGTGYLGATHAAAMAELGFEVLGLDVVPEKIEMLQRGEVPMYEPGLEDLLRKHVAGIEGASGRLRFTMDWAEVADFGDVHFICVNTPQKHGEYACDMSYVDNALESLAKHLTKASLVVGKSTVPVGSADRLASRLAELAPAGDEVELAWNPEFLREGFAVNDTLHPDRIVVGVRSERAEKLLREVYASPIGEGSPFVVTDFPTSELVKTSANSFLATKISFINAMAEVCEAAGGDVVKLAEALGHDDRIGKKFLRAGIGFGGGCLPKDIRAFMARAGELGADQALTFLREIDSINMRRRGQMVEMAREALGGGSFLGKRVAVLGATFKPDSDDVRDSPALNVAGQIHLQGGQVTVYDPKGMENARRLFPTLGYAETALDAVRGADVVLHLTEWREFRELDPAELAAAAAAPLILDGRNALDPWTWRAAGWTYRAMGRPAA
ncbi:MULTISPECIES: UDP-glucose/GDP-mannose dehydrogenase family protein [Streptomyces]|uniref:UDP-glucose 6-dehydrogenase n=1 Tax=Streptomyces venezuelae TaxID=54571 RepID=A0A5P2BM40_STRVZ|nr:MULTISPECIES: UDP-glucose/GDP-mannose dehydrogenase family protein [Streptomyces]NEA01298.1 UDP-glucose/GDP-mannose dehydrogenase family protein [Streptomyces sp. SID10116]MYY85908.1 nucleotide sugar dehydrogenase [Streptomyces sp. SID335]MYZ18027.1 nucleotide sugar dehydrogenase [Streptomyces sp. SID337]NDZ91469.1 UDP-glucose/GDP-mannose dehydrogenase family protein [Streptomyces sp. SID10115]NEB44237.1 UDP-glucose/GDP-mannose dehydrogenase family protein [Streptomyces sp. SID339]